MEAAEKALVEPEQDEPSVEQAEEFVLTPEQEEAAPVEHSEEFVLTPEQDALDEAEPTDASGFALRPLVPFSIQIVATALIFAGALLIVDAGVRGPRSLVGFGMFTLGFVGFDGLYRGRFGFRQVSMFFGWLAAGIGGWAVFVSTLLTVLELPVGAELRTLLIVAAACAAASAAAALLSVRSWGVGHRLRERLRSATAWVSKRISRLDEPRPAQGFGSEQPWRPAEPARED
jgi:hypothetical protein